MPHVEGLLGAEAFAVSQWLYSTFAADVGGGSMVALAPGGFHDGADADKAVGYPLVRWDVQSPFVVVGTGAGTAEIMLNGLMRIVAVTEGSSYTPLVPIAQRIHTLIHGSLNVPLETGTLNTCMREEALHRPETQGGREFRHLGGIYRFYIEA